MSCGLRVAHTSYDNDKRNLQPATAVAFRFEELGIHSRKQALAFGKKPNARFAVLQTAIRGCASAMLKTMQILALHSAFTRIVVL